MAAISWTDPAFAQLESLPETIAFEIVHRVDLLEAFPEMGPALESEYPQLRNCRQLVVGRSHRVIYEHHRRMRRVSILAVQHCRQPLPTARELRRRQTDEPG